MILLLKIIKPKSCKNKLIVNKSYKTENAFKKLQNDNYNIEFDSPILRAI